jgi:hypothetical protein
MKKTSYIFIGLCLLTFISCSKDEKKEILGDNIVFKEGTVLQKGLVLEKNNLINEDRNSEFRNVLKNKEDNPQTYLLGRTYDLKYINSIQRMGVKFPVINMEKFIESKSSYVINRKLRESEAISLSFTKFEEVDIYNFEKKIRKGGLKIKAPMFSVGARVEYESTFSSHNISSENNVFGKIEIDIRNRNYELLLAGNVIEDIKDEYLDESFVNSLFYSSSSDFLNTIGEVVMTNIILGGKAKAIYSGISKSDQSMEQKTRNLTTIIDGSFEIITKGGKVDTDIDVTFGKNTDKKIIQKNKFEMVEMAVKTIGGSTGISSYTVPKSVENINLDLSSWTSSLDNWDTNVLIDFVDNSLIPVNEFIRPNNLKFNIENYINKGQNNVLQQPKLLLLMINNKENSLRDVIFRLVLQTRFGDLLNVYESSALLSRDISDYNNIEELFITERINLFKDYEQNNPLFTDLEMVYYFYGYYDLMKNSKRVYTKDIINVNTQRVKKYIDKNYNITYILLENNIALALKDKYIINAYNIKNWVDSIEEVKEEPLLRTFEIIAL